MKCKTSILSFFLLFFLLQAKPETLPRNAFLNVTPNARPWCYWYWMNGCVSKEGIKADLKAMRDVGLEGAYLFTIRGRENPSKYEPAIEQLTPEWWNMLKFTMEEADSMNLKIAMHICDGFALAGGPWITPEKSMQKVVWTETLVKGKRHLKIKLRQPETKAGFYKDISVLAYPTPSGFKNERNNPVKITSSETADSLNFLISANGKGTFRSEKDCWIQYEYKKPFLCRSITTKVNGTNYQCHRFKVEASDDGVNFRFVARLEPPRHGWQNTGADVTHAVPPTEAKFFRFSWTKEGSEPGAEDLDNAKWKPVLKLTGLLLSSEPKIHHFEGKNASVWRVSSATTEKQLPDGTCIPKDKIIDITTFMSSDGLLKWNAPKGDWTILRIGHTSTGMTNSTGGAGAGLECDKFCKDAVQLQFDNWFGKACDMAGPELVSKVLKIMHIDSWECGSQNWSETFAQEFEKRRGYSLIPYLPVMAGIPVDSATKSEQVLYDVRQTISELINDVFFKTMADAAHAKGCEVSFESVAPTMVSDGMLHYRTADIPMGEFWYDSPTHDKLNDMLDAVSGAHVYGKNIIQAEGFTQLRTVWDETPANHKAILDRNFALGMNKLVFHVFTHNPFMDRKPGMTLSGMGLFFQRDQTWFNYSGSWIDYISRCQSLLQLGHPVVDIAVFNGLELPRRAILPDRLVPFLPGIVGRERVESERKRLQNQGVPVTESPVGVEHTAGIIKAEDWVDPLHGYSYDTFNPDVLFRLAKPENNQLDIPDGPSYKILIVPQPHPMAPDAVTPYTDEEIRLRDVLSYFSQAGVPILATGKLAGDLNIKSSLPWNEDDFSALKITRDLEVKENGKPVFGSIAWNHRAGKGFDLYFISNQKDESRQIEVKLRVAGMVPEIFDPIDGSIREVSDWKSENGRTSLSLDLAPFASLFVVFEYPASGKSCNIKSADTTKIFSPDINTGLWAVRFDTLYGGPKEPIIFSTLKSWSENDDSAIKYYSGTALYSKKIWIDIKPEEGKQYRLNLGKVSDIAEVHLNGKSCGVAWTEPYSVDVTQALKNGLNQLEIYVTNTWANRLEGDSRLPEKERITWTDGKYRKKSGTLLDAGLFGPLMLESSNLHEQKPMPEFIEKIK
jgi:hypothetical protein